MKGAKHSFGGSAGRTGDRIRKGNSGALGDRERSILLRAPNHDATTGAEVTSSNRSERVALHRAAKRLQRAGLVVIRLDTVRRPDPRTRSYLGGMRHYTVTRVWATPAGETVRDSLRAGGAS
jgi:hypothetical protein